MINEFDNCKDSKYNLKIYESKNFSSCNSFVVSGDLKSCKKILKTFVKQSEQAEYSMEIVRCCDGKCVQKWGL